MSDDSAIPSDPISSAPPPPAPETLTDATPPPAIAPPRGRRRLLIVIGSVVVAVALIGTGLGIAFGTLSSSHDPKVAVSAFLDQVVAGHAEAAVRLLSPAPGGNQALLSDAVYGATTDRPTGYRIVSTEVHGAAATVTAELQTAGSTFTESYALHSTGKELLFFDTWVIDGSRLPSLTVTVETPAGGTVIINGARVSTDVLAAGGTLLALPGSYQVAYDSGNANVAAPPQTVTVTSSTATTSPADLHATLTDAGVAAAQAAVSGFLSGCLGQAALVPTGRCGWGLTDGSGKTLTDIHWTVEQTPVVGFDPFNIDGFEVTTTTTGRFRMDAKFSGGTATGTIDGYHVAGYITVAADGTPTFTSEYAE